MRLFTAGIPSRKSLFLLPCMACFRGVLTLSPLSTKATNETGVQGGIPLSGTLNWHAKVLHMLRILCKRLSCLDFFKQHSLFNLTPAPSSVTF